MRWLRGKGSSVPSRTGELLALPGAVCAVALPTILPIVLLDPSGPVLAEQEADWSLGVFPWLVMSGFVILSHERPKASMQRSRWLSLALAAISIGSFLYSLFHIGSLSFGTPRHALAPVLRGSAHSTHMGHGRAGPRGDLVDLHLRVSNSHRGEQYRKAVSPGFSHVRPVDRSPVGRGSYC